MDTVVQNYEVLKFSSILCQTLAVSFTIVGTLIFSFGFVLMMQEPNSTPIDSWRPFRFTALWWRGMSLNILGALIQMISCLYLSPYISTHVNTFTLLTNLLLSRILFHAMTSFLESVYILGICLGSILCIVISFFPCDQSYIIPGIESWNSQAYQSYVYLCAGLLAVVLVLSKTVRSEIQTLHKPKALRNMFLEWFKKPFQLNCIKKYNQNTRNTINDCLLHSNTASYHKKNILLLAHTALLESIAAGTVGAQIDLQLRECYTLLQILPKDKFIYLTPNLIVCLILVSIETLLQMYFFNSAIKNSSVSLVLPIHYVFCFILGSLGRCIKFREFWGYTEHQFNFLMVGFFLTILCITGLTKIELQRLFNSLPDLQNEK